MTTSVYSINNNLRNINYDTIIKSLIYKQLNPPKYDVYHFNRNSYLGTVLSTSELLRFNVQGKGIIHQFFVYNINHKIVKYRHYYTSEEKKKENEEKRKENKEKRMERKNRKNREIYRI